MRKGRLSSLFAVGTMAVTLICIIGLQGGHAGTLSPFEVLYSFAGGTNDGAGPWGSLTLSGTTLYGMNPGGGANNAGTIFKFDTKTNVETVLYCFAGGTNDGANPFGPLTLSGSTLYGMTNSGGAKSNGVIFKFDTKTNLETVLHSFAGGTTDGAYPYGSLTLSGTTLYGMTPFLGFNGSSGNNGVIFKFDTKTNVETILYSFAGGTTDGMEPMGSLTLSRTTLYGMTSLGGANGLGTIFKFDTKTNVETVLYSFGSVANDGAEPCGSLTLSGTTLYGTTAKGGANGLGTIFKFDTKTNVETVLHSFAGGTNDGAAPQGDLILSGTTLYGMTHGGGAKDLGTIFSIPDVPLSTISGLVTTNPGTPNSPGATVTLSQPHWTSQTIPNIDGFYSFGYLAPGNYTITPSQPGYAFTPASASVTVTGNHLYQNFTKTPVTISGTVTFSGAAVTTDLTMNLKSAKATETDIPDSSGYTFGPLANGTYTVRPVLTHHKPVPLATPPSATIIIKGKSVTQNFTYKTKATCFTADCH